MGNDVKPFTLIVGAQCGAIAQTGHLHFSVYCLETD